MVLARDWSGVPTWQICADFKQNDGVGYAEICQWDVDTCHPMSSFSGWGTRPGRSIAGRTDGFMEEIEARQHLVITFPKHLRQIHLKQLRCWRNGAHVILCHPESTRRRRVDQNFPHSALDRDGINYEEQVSPDAGNFGKETGDFWSEENGLTTGPVEGSWNLVDSKQEGTKRLAEDGKMRKGWLAQFKSAAGGIFNICPMIPVKEEFWVLEKDPMGTSFVWEGWGTSLCWWANFVGGLPQSDMDSVLDMFFDQQKGLGLNIARYNIGGGGADLDFDTNLRPFAEIPGFQPSANGKFEWSADEGQRKVLLGAKARGVTLFEAFSNSPPRWMTLSGSVTGNWRRGQDNLDPKHYDAFVEYLAEVVQQYELKWGLHFDYLAPFNEPVEGFWNIDRKKPAQEGCNFSISTINMLIPKLKKELSRRHLSTKLSAVDSWSLNTAKVLRGLGEETLAVISNVNVHTYIPFVQREGDARRREVQSAVSALGKKLWMSEYGPLNWRGNELDVALAVSKHITLDLNELQPSAWCYWQVMEVPGKNFYWGLLHCDFNYSSHQFIVQVKKQYYIMMHFSRWIRPGFTIYPSDDKFRDCLVIAVDPSRKSVVMIFTNTSDRNRDVSFDVSSIAPALKNVPIQAALVRTSDTENHQELPTEYYGTAVMMLRLVAKSITTILVSKSTMK